MSSIYGGDAYPLRASHLQLLKDVATIQGAQRVAHQVGTSARAIEAYVDGQPPSSSERTKVIQFLLRSGLVRPSPKDRDVFAPDGSEQHTPQTKRHSKALAREARR